MVIDILTPMNHREIEYHAKQLSGCHIPDSFNCDNALLEWLDETGKRVFDEDLVMDYGTDCLRLYLLFENTPKEKDAPYYESWQEGALEGIYKFLGRYRRMILAADAWNRRGNYNENDVLSAEGIEKMHHALEDTAAKIRKYIGRGNTRPNRHNIVSAMMELLNLYRKELKTGEIISALHADVIQSAVPHDDRMPVTHMEKKQKKVQQIKNNIRNYNEDAAKLYRNFIILMAPYAPDLSKILWLTIHSG